jgi:hypothetical protein
MGDDTGDLLVLLKLCIFNWGLFYMHIHFVKTHQAIHLLSINFSVLVLN